MLLDISDSVLSSYRHRRFKGDLTALEAKVEQLLDREEPLTPPLGSAYVETETTLDIIDFLGVCEDKAFLGILYGPSGCGKTCALAMYRQRRPGTVAVAAGPRWRTADHVIQGIAHRLGTYGEEGILHSLKWSRALVVIDEAQLLQFSALEQARWLHDAAGTGVVLCGTPDLLRTIKQRHFEQLQRRSIYRAVGFDIPADDADQVARMICPGLGEEALGFLRREANATGKLGRVQKLLETAAVVAGGNLIGLAALKEAAGWLRA